MKDYVSKLTDDKKYSITIVIGGTLKENDEFCIVLAYDDHVETMRRRFKQIHFEHLYSIQPISRFHDINNALCLADNSLNNYINLPSSIKKKEKGNNLIHKQCVEIPEEKDLPSTEQKNSTPTKVVNNSIETVVNKTLDKTEKKVILILNLIDLFLYFVTFICRKPVWILLPITKIIMQNPKKQKQKLY